MRHTETMNRVDVEKRVMAELKLRLEKCVSVEKYINRVIWKVLRHLP